MRVKMYKQPPPAPTASAVGPCPTIIQIVGRPGTGSLPSTFAPPDHPLLIWSTGSRLGGSSWATSSLSTLFAESTVFILYALTLLHSERPKLYTILAFLSAIGLRVNTFLWVWYNEKTDKILWFRANETKSLWNKKFKEIKNRILRVHLNVEG